MNTFRLFYTVMILIASFTLTAQVAINTDGSSPDASAILDMQSTTKGVLLPRLTDAERDAISSPVAGLVIFNIDVQKLQIYNGSVWKSMSVLSWICSMPFFDVINNKYYNTTQIGSQCWMAENIASTKYNDGTDIPLVIDNTVWETLSTPAYCWNFDLISYGYTCGGLYNWYAVNTGKLCPTGWHVPTDTEWTILTTYAGGDTVAGAKLKLTGPY